LSDKTETPPVGKVFQYGQAGGGLLRKLHNGGLRTFGTDFGIELDLLAFGEGTEAFALDGGEVYKYISVACILGLNKSKPFGFVKPLNSTSTH